MATNKKFVRAVNFSFDEEHRLLDIVEKHKDIIECKRSDAVTWKEKERVWQLIADEFNAQSKHRRNVKELQLKYKCLKKAAKKEAARQLQSLRATGGGPYDPPRNSAILERVLKLIPLAATGLAAGTDSDVMAPIQAESLESQGSEMDEPELQELHYDSDDETRDFELILPLHEETQPGCSGLQSANVIAEGPDDWSKYTPASLRRPKHPALKGKKTANIRVKSAAAQYAELQQETESALLNEGGSANNASRRRPVPLQKETVSSASMKKYSLLAVSKTELAKVQKDLLMQEYAATEATNSQEHELRMKIMNAQLRHTEVQIQNEEADLKIKMLKIQSIEKHHQSE